ncbi:MAG: DNA repair protein RecO C-terminal domain-containing protein [Patescibacteria group bacterium]
MEKVFVAKAIVLSKKKWRENDLFFCLLTDNFGKIDVLASGAQKITSKLSGQLAGSGICEINYVQGNLYKRLIQACLVEKFSLAEENDFYYYQAFLEILDKVFPTEEKNEGLFIFIKKAIAGVLSEKNQAKKKLLFSVFLIKLLVFLGFAISENEKFINAGGGMNFQNIKDFINKAQSEKGEPLGLSLLLSEQGILFDFLQKFLHYHVEKEFQSLGFLSKFR